MKTMEDLTPGQFTDLRDGPGIAFLPVGPFEWHGPHLPLGTDPIHAHYLAVRIAEVLGGLVLPPLFAGTETIVPATGRPHNLSGMGLDPGDRVIGMDFPANSVKSMYFEESVFALTVREMVRSLRKNGFQTIVIVNGHGAANHVSTLHRLAAEESDAKSCRVVIHPAWGTSELQLPGVGHASRHETSIMMAIRPDDVHIELLPPLGLPLRYQDFAIVDGPAFSGNPTQDFTVREEYDPRISTPEDGKAMLDKEISNAVQHVSHHLNQSDEYHFAEESRG